MPDFSYYDNMRENPRVQKAVFVKYDLRNETNNPVGTGVATSRDISAGGLKFMCTKPARKGYIIKMQIQLDKLNTFGAIGTIAWVETLRPGQFMVGVKFENLPEIHKQKIIKFLNKMAPGD